jgi:KaiC/GvpD/RAD55 family RecA-like ATPase
LAESNKVDVAPYNFDLRFERAVVLLACSSPRFFGRVGSALEADGFALAPARMAVGAAQAIARESGRGPSDPAIVLQRIRRYMSQGQVTLEQVQEVGDLFEAAEDDGRLPEDEVVEELKPVLQRRAHLEAVRAATDAFGKRGDMGTVVKMLERAAAIGGQDVSVGSRFGGGGLLDETRDMERITTGVPELDLALDGGQVRGTLFVWLAPTGAGKSMALANQACAGMRERMFVGYATLELPEYIVKARLAANLTNVPINALLEARSPSADNVLRVSSGLSLAQERLEILTPRLGPCMIKSFTPHATSIDDLKEWVARCEDVEGRAMDMLVVDYADKMNAPKEKSEYEGQRAVYEGIRVFADANRKWACTASQAKNLGKESGKHKLDTHHAADSMHKSRVTDYMVSINPFGEAGDQAEYFVAKHRIGRSRMCVGPIPTDFAVARLCPVPPTPEGW